MLIAVVVALVLVAAGAAAARYVSRSGEWSPGRMIGLIVAMCVAVLAAAVGLNFVQLLYRPPTQLVAALIVSALTAAGLFFALAYAARRKPLAVVALLGIVVATNLGFMLFAMAFVPEAGWLQDLYAKRTAAIAESQGFTGLLRSDARLSTESLPVEAMAEPDAGIWLSYRDCMVQERRLAAPRTEAELRKLVARGSKPLGPDAPPIPADAELTTMTVAGAPALGVVFLALPPRAAGDAPPPIREKTMLLLAQVRGVDVRIASQDVLKEEGQGSWAPQTGLSLEALRGIAESLRPVEPRP
jgi:hypothetical protein